MEAIRLVTPEGTALYPVLITPRANELKKDKEGHTVNEFSTIILFDKGADLSEIEGAIKQAVLDEFGSDRSKWPKNLKTPLKDQATLLDKEGKPRPGTTAGAMFLNLKTNAALYTPKVFGPQGQQIIETDDLYSGMRIRAKVTFKAYNMPTAKGVAVYLSDVLKVSDAERLVQPRNAIDDFAQYLKPADSFNDFM